MADKQGYLYQGIAGRAFERRFQLAEHVEVRGAKLENGLLHVDLERIVPEEKKPRRIAINAPELLKTIEGTGEGGLIPASTPPQVGSRKGRAFEPGPFVCVPAACRNL